MIEEENNIQSDKKEIRILPIPKFDGYFISEDGVVYSNKSGTMKMLRVGYIESSTGLTYKTIYLYNQVFRIKKYIHRLVHEIFNGSKKIPYHVDGNCFNNHYTNLTDRKKEYTLQEGEKWVHGFEGRYLIFGGNVYSVLNKEYPVKLKPSYISSKKKYSLVETSGKVVSFYL